METLQFQCADNNQGLKPVFNHIEIKNGFLRAHNQNHCQKLELKLILPCYHA
jgi:hypothetical protein